MCAYVYMPMSMCVHACVQCVGKWMCACVYMPMCMCVHMCTYMYVCVLVCTFAHVGACEGQSRLMLRYFSSITFLLIVIIVIVIII